MTCQYITQDYFYSNRCSLYQSVLDLSALNTVISVSVFVSIFACALCVCVQYTVSGAYFKMPAYMYSPHLCVHVVTM